MLIERGRAGERDALNALLRRYDRRILRVCERVARTTDEAQDLFQETMMAIVRNLAGFRGDASFMTWVFTIARSFAHRERRRERSRERAGAGLRDAMTTQAPALATPNLEHTIDQQRLSTQFQRAIAELAPLDRDVLVARDIEGLTAPEAAQQTGLTVSAVKSRLHRARRQVRAALTAAAVRVGSRSFSSPASGASG
ncbi:MAG: sigma-70 family RNA polymerase sigma factor [Myxococcales bacterium]|nr:sigma-70 family RNA polymerase sigma factor [Myxococcales bacterium]